MARRGKGRSINGVVLLDKPTDISSNHALQRVFRKRQVARGTGVTLAETLLSKSPDAYFFGTGSKERDWLLKTIRRTCNKSKIKYVIARHDARSIVVTLSSIDRSLLF